MFVALFGIVQYLLRVGCVFGLRLPATDRSGQRHRFQVTTLHLRQQFRRRAKEGVLRTRFEEEAVAIRVLHRQPIKRCIQVHVGRETQFRYARQHHFLQAARPNASRRAFDHRGPGRIRHRVIVVHHVRDTQIDGLIRRQQRFAARRQCLAQARNQIVGVLVTWNLDVDAQPACATGLDQLVMWQHEVGRGIDGPGVIRHEIVLEGESAEEARPGQPLVTGLNLCSGEQTPGLPVNRIEAILPPGDQFSRDAETGQGIAIAGVLPVETRLTLRKRQQTARRSGHRSAG